MEQQRTERALPPVTNRAASVKRSEIRVMFDLAEQQGGDLVRLELGEPDFDTPAHIVDAASRAARNGATHYTQNAGILELRQAIADWTAATDGVSVDPQTELLVTTGGMEALHLALLTVANPGDDVVIPTPSWPNYVSATKLANANPVEVALPAETGFQLDADRVVDAMSEDTAVVLLASPSNPTGRVYDEAAIERVIEAAIRYDAYVVADEVYKGLTYGENVRSVAEFTDHPDRVLTVDSFSKRFAMTGWRIGWLAGPEKVLDTATKIRESTTSCTSTVAQHAAIAALTGPSEPLEEMRSSFHERRDYVVDRVESIPGIHGHPPEGAFYAFIDVSALDGTSVEVAKRLLNEYGVATAPGTAFGDGGDGYLRLNFANSLDRLEVGFDRIESMVQAELSK